MASAVIWDFDETLARRAGRWSDMLVDILDEESPAHPWPPHPCRRASRMAFPGTAGRGHIRSYPIPTGGGTTSGRVGRRAGGRGRQQAASHKGAVEGPLEYTRLDRWAVFPDTVPALERLKGLGWRQAILSNHCPELPDLVRGLGLSNYFDVVLTSAATGFEKPHPEAYALAVRALGHPDPVWMVGDSPEVDIDGALRCGIPGVLVRRPAPGYDYAPDLTTAVETIIARASRAGGQGISAD